MPRLAAFTLLLLLALPATAGAKEITSAKVCGASECREVDDHDTLMAMQSGDASGPPKNASAEWYRATFVVRGEGRELHRFTLAAVPSTGHLRAYDPDSRSYSWMTMATDARGAYREITAGLAPRPGSTLRGLDQKPPEVIVDEVVEPPAQPATQPAGAFPWEWVAGGLTATALAGGLFLRARRRRRGSAQPRPGPQAAG